MLSSTRSQSMSSGSGESLGFIIGNRNVRGPWSLAMVSNIEEGFQHLSSIDVNTPLLFVYDRVWSEIENIVKYLSQRGFNIFYIDFVDAGLEEGFAGGVIDLGTIVYARLLKLRFSDASRAPVRIGLEKVVDRRSLLRFGPIAALEYLDKPVADGGPCSSIPRCSICVNSCPVKALSGKPPIVEYDKRVECGICYSLCPIEAIHSPQVTSRSIEAFISAIRDSSRELFNVLIAPYNMLRELARVKPSPGYPTLFFPLWSLAEVTPLHLLKMAYYGFTPIIYGRGQSIPEHLGELAKLGAIRIAFNIEELERELSRRPSYDIGALDSSPRGYVIKVLDKLVDHAVLGFPGAGFLDVNRDLCTFCKACVKACPTEALDIVEAGEVAKLILVIDYCLGCGECEISCLEGAIKVSWAYEKGHKEKVLVESPIARCSRCGAPIGSEALIKSVERKLEKAGFIKVLKYTRLCQRCKAELALQGKITYP